MQMKLSHTSTFYMYVSFPAYLDETGARLIPRIRIPSRTIRTCDYPRGELNMSVFETRTATEREHFACQDNSVS